MSSINPGSVNLASSFAGAQRSDASADKQKAEAAQQNMAIDQKAMTDHQLHDVGDADKAGDRDADGRMPMGHDEEEGRGAQDESNEQEAEEEHPKAPDAEGTLGTHLDLDA
ncbi:hypothetical protein [Gimesia fumaroli]|jgi:hypothetical protein|uniref:Uncharacterized protein n=1 Tax=Gimesia fumaroli TaxID=2527976 RepID=A0A518ICG4_9PLAN|nr:hypothetical protein [Gimesia fumaroli]QDV50795.1 hypothetical protein Enr17x_28390 [Gimesia fumaroli]